MAERTRALEEKLSDALHNALRQRFVDRRTSMLLRKATRDDALLPVEVDADNQVFVDGEHIGALDGFAFTVDPLARVGERKLLLAAAERHLAAYLKQRARAVAMAETQEFSLERDAEGRPALFWQGAMLGHLVKGRNLLQPLFKPVRAVAGLEGEDLRAIVEKADGWVQAQLAKHMGGLIALNQLAADAATDGVVRALAARLADAGGIAGRQFLADTLTALPKEARGAARKAGIVFGALDVYHHAILKPAATRWRAALFSALTEKPMPDLPPESAVHLKDWEFASAADCRNAGYRRVGSEYVRIDLAERVVRKAHEARGDKNDFGLDMAFATSLGLSEEGLEALMRDAGFRKMKAPSLELPAADGGDASAGEAAETAASDTVVEEAPVVEEEAAVTAEGQLDMPPVIEAESPDSLPVLESDSASTEVAAPVSSANLTYWRWIGIRKPRPQAARPDQGQMRGKPKGKGKPGEGRKPHAPREKAPQTRSAPAAPTALALQLAALKEKMGG
jgi:ATP-dependent RNA helicase SUPV3L1/SUV3